MGTLALSRFALSISAAAALLAGCGGSQPPIGAPGAIAQTSALATHAERGTSWMLPEVKSEKLVYIAAGSVYVYAYGTSKLVGMLPRIGDTLYECADRKGDVFVTVY